MMKCVVKSLALALGTAAVALGAGSANAANVSWAIGVNLPVYAAPVPLYAPVPVYAEAEPVYVAAPPPVAYYPRGAVYVRPVPVIYPRYYGHWQHGHRHGWHGR